MEKSKVEMKQEELKKILDESGFEYLLIMGDPIERRSVRVTNMLTANLLGHVELLKHQILFPKTPLDVISTSMKSNPSLVKDIVDEIKKAHD
jgi:hypothetical protein